MIPKAIRVFPLGKIKEPNVFGTIEMVYDFFCEHLPSRIPPGRFNIPTEKVHFEKNSLILFQYAEKKNEEKIIGHAVLLSDGCIPDKRYTGYIGYYLLDPDSIVLYKNPVSKEEIYKIWNKTLYRSKLKLATTKYNEYMTLLKNKGNLKSQCP
ncbi:MAG TPA: hypothetical protein VGD14_20855 [bacterium]